MEDSFRVRVEKAFGSLPIPSAASLWSLSEDETNNKPKPKPESQPKPYPSSPPLEPELENDLDDLDDEDENAAPSKPSDYDDEQWQVKSGIGLDCTLDFEEEEDHYDKQALGQDDLGDRVYMSAINEDGIGISSRAFGGFSRDPRANHMAAKIKLEQDDGGANGIDDVLRVSAKSTTPDIGGGGGGGDSVSVNPKSILKSKDNTSESRPNKRVRFDSERVDGDGDDDGKEGTRDVRMKSSSMEEDAALNQPSKLQEFASAVPDYIRNPSRYTHYTFDSSTDIDDKANKEAYMSFLAQIKGSNASTEADEALDDLPSVTFIPKKKSGDVTMGENETVSKLKLDVEKDCMNKKAFPVTVAAAGDTENSDVCAMEEDEEEVIEDTKRSSQRSNRKYRKKTDEELEEPVI
ncbi:unnamed protein product [Vicia faba]|uniref:U5 small nuclear ribonucleoprotein TSSC4 n=1 Tax=Vicia faba TaxID=3906 RepID=A0AAV1AUF1_VICFA|nr:unnamed protein product [Vicia faba]